MHTGGGGRGGVGGGGREKVSRCLSNAKWERIPIHCFLL